MKETKREATFTCGGCLEEIPIGQLHEFDGRNLCPECFPGRRPPFALCEESGSGATTMPERQKRRCVSGVMIAITPAANVAAPSYDWRRLVTLPMMR